MNLWSEMDLFNLVIYSALGLLFSYVGVVFSMTGGMEVFYITGGALFLTYAGTIFYVAKKYAQGKGPQSAFVLIFPMPFVTVLFMAYGIVSYMVMFVMPDSSDFSAKCMTAGAKYIKSPASPVHSIAYYKETEFSPHFTSLSVSWGSRISSITYYNEPIHPSIEFTEIGPMKFGPRYTRHLKGGKEYGVDSLVSDVLVKIKMGPNEELKKPLGAQGIVTYELTVVDQRTNEELAQLRYVTDTEHRRACGLTGENTLSEREFILKAIGLL